MRFNYNISFQNTNLQTMNQFTENSGIKIPFYKRVWDLYYDGFRSMTVGKSLWVLIIIKLLVMFVILKWFFFPNLLKENYDNDEDRAEAVRTELTTR